MSIRDRALHLDRPFRPPSENGPIRPKQVCTKGSIEVGRHVSRRLGFNEIVVEALIVEAVVAASAVPLAVGTAIAVRRRGVAPAPRLPSRRAMGALIGQLPHRHRREAKLIVALARDHEKRNSSSQLDAFTAREALRSYLPDTIDAYLAVPKDLRRRARNGRLSPDEELTRQLRTLRLGLERLRDGDADIADTRMAENRTFLHERFGTPPADGPLTPPTVLERVSGLIDDFLRGV